MENFVLSCMHVCGVYMCRMFLTWENMEDFKDSTCLSWKTRHRYAGLVNDDKENSCRIDAQRKETRIYTRPAWLIAVRERMLQEFYSDSTTQFMKTLVLAVIS